MGTTLNQILDAVSLLKRVKPNGSYRILDIGRQEIFHEVTIELLAKSFNQVGISISNSELKKIAETRDVNRIFAALEVDYSSVDIYKSENCSVYDLNFDKVARRAKHKYDMVRNLGTTEHLLNQYNAFLSIHDFTAPDGIMHHSLPMSHFWGHGFFKYDPKFFIMMASINRYKILESNFYNAEGDSDKLIAEYLNTKDFQVDHRHLAIEFIMQKTSNDAFQTPLDLDVQGIDAEVLHFNYQREIVA